VDLADRVDRVDVLRYRRAHAGRCILRAPSPEDRAALEDQVADQALVDRVDAPASEDQVDVRALADLVRERLACCLRDRLIPRDALSDVLPRAGVAGTSVTRSQKKAR
jgi:hypothetical protein